MGELGESDEMSTSPSPNQHPQTQRHTRRDPNIGITMTKDETFLFAFNFHVSISREPGHDKLPLASRHSRLDPCSLHSLLWWLVEGSGR